MKPDIGKERDQLIESWRGTIKENPDWFASEIEVVKKLLAAARSSSDEQDKVDGYLRYFHDMLGFKAKDTLQKRGLCAGAIYRTRAFIILDQAERNGTRDSGTVHIEHTVPVNNLKTAILNSNFADYKSLMIWIAKHSVTTAFLKDQKRFLKGREHHTNALNLASREYQKPFMRYKDLFSSGEVIWNVFDGSEVCPASFTFANHLGVVSRLLDEVSPGNPMVRMFGSI